VINSGLPLNLPEIKDIALVKILCAYKAYKEHDNIAQFWHQTDENGNITAVMGCINGYLNLWSNNTYPDEVFSFLKFISPNGIFTSKETAEVLKLKINEPCHCFFKLPPFERISNTEYKEPRQLLKILRKGLEIPDGDGFVSDVSFRKYHGCADYVTYDGGGALLYTADSVAIINGIAVPKDKRGKGVGSKLISLLLSCAENRTVYTCCTNKNKNFYLKNGFTYFGDAAYCEEK